MAIVTITPTYTVSTDYIDAIKVTDNDPDIIYMNNIETAVLDNISFSSTWQVYGSLRINPIRISSASQTSEGYVITTLHGHSFTVPEIQGTLADIIADSSLSGGSGGSGGGSNAPFVVDPWDMTGPEYVINPVNAIGCYINGTSTNLELMPAAPLYTDTLSISESRSGVLLRSVGQRFGKITLPSYNAGDNWLALIVVIVNSAAHMEDINPPVPGVWAKQLIILNPRYSSACYASDIVNGVVIGLPVSGPTFDYGDTIYFGLDYDNEESGIGTLVVQKNLEAGVLMGNFNNMGMPSSQSLKILVAMQFTNPTPSLADTSVNFAFGTIDNGMNPFTYIGDAVPPVDAVDGLVYEVTSPGSFNGLHTSIGDYIQLYDDTTKGILIPSASEISALESTVNYLDTQVANLTGFNSTDTLSVITLDPGIYTFGTSPSASLKKLMLGSNDQLFNLAAATGTVVKFFVEIGFNDYLPLPNDIFTLNGRKFNVNSSDGSMWEVYHNPDNGIFNLRVDKYTEPSVVATVSLVDGNSYYDVPHCSSTHIVLDTSLLTGNLGKIELVGLQFDYLVDLYGQLTVEMGSTFGCTYFQDTTFGLAAGEKAVRFPGGIWVKV